MRVDPGGRLQPGGRRADAARVTRPLRRAAAGVVVACLLAWAVPAAVLEGTSRAVATTSALAAGALLGALACAWRARAQQREHRRAGWLLVGASSAVWAAGEALWAVPGVPAGTTEAPPAADLLFVSSAGLAVLGLLLLALRGSVVVGRLLVALDAAVVATSALAVTWPWLVVPFASSAPGSAALLQAVASVGYLVADAAAITVGVLVLVLARSGRGARWRGPLPLLAGAAVCLGVGDYLTGQAGLAGVYAFGHPSEAPYVLRAALLVLAALGARDDEERVPPLPGRVLLVLPYVVALVAVGTVLHRASVGDVTGPVLAVVGMLSVLLIVRQVLTVLQHTALRRDLEARVVERTHQLARQEEWFRTVLHHSSDAVTAVDADGVVVWQSESALQALVGGVPGRRLRDGGPVGDARAQLVEALDEVTASPGSSRTLAWSAPPIGPGGQEHHLETALTSLVHDPVVAAVVMTTRDVTERTQLQHQLSHQAFHDSLTGLANRDLFRDRLDHRLSARADDRDLVAVLFCDLDGFKGVNDTAGHAAGDALLREVADRLSSVVRPGDTVARLGGDEFAVLLDRVEDAEEAEQVARRVSEALAAPVVLAGKRMAVGGSVGLAVTDTGLETGEELLRGADLAMYSAKAQRTGEPARFCASMHEQFVARLRVEEGLRTALAEGHLRVHYQPTVALGTGRVTGVEALVRWQQPDGDLVPPLDFIPVAEETGLISALGEWVLREACTQGARWLSSPGGPVAVSVNVSGRQLVPALVPAVAGVLAETGFPPELLVLELTESVLVDGAGTVALLQALRDLGVRLAIDDFGTGYSSLAYLSRLPVDVIKVDRSFVGDLGGAGDRAELARTIIDMARALGLSTTAEGVENDEQLQQLRELGCDLGQGYLFSRPVPPEQLDTLLVPGVLLEAPAGAAVPHPRAEHQPGAPTGRGRLAPR